MKNYAFAQTLILLFLIIPVSKTDAQVPKKTIVEHFTNTNCSICANKNPGFYTNLNSQQNILHLAVHPSSPYPSCLLYQQNPSANDARTNYYGVYGGTPRLVVNGDVLAANVNYSSSAIFAPYIGLTSPVSIRIEQEKFGNDSIRSTVIIKTEATHMLGSLALFVALVEDTVNYTGGNGEPAHYDVFRKSLTSPMGDALAISPVAGDSLVYSYSSATDTNWDFSRIYTMAILQENVNKQVVQAEAVLASQNNITTSLYGDPATLEFSVHPNPVSDQLLITLDEPLPVMISIYSMLGQKVLTLESDRKNITIDTDHLLAGEYIVHIIGEKSGFSTTIVKE